jgi:hypothetical protein
VQLRVQSVKTETNGKFQVPSIKTVIMDHRTKLTLNPFDDAFVDTRPAETKYTLDKMLSQDTCAETRTIELFLCHQQRRWQKIR